MIAQLESGTLKNAESQTKLGEKIEDVELKYFSKEKIEKDLAHRSSKHHSHGKKEMLGRKWKAAIEELRRK